MLPVHLAAVPILPVISKPLNNLLRPFPSMETVKWAGTDDLWALRRARFSNLFLFGHRYSGYEGPWEASTPTSCPIHGQLWGQAALLRDLSIEGWKKDGDKTTFTEQPAPVLDCAHGQNASAHIQSESLASTYACGLSSSHIQCCKELGSLFSVNSFWQTAIPWSLLFSFPDQIIPVSSLDNSSSSLSLLGAHKLPTYEFPK